MSDYERGEIAELYFNKWIKKGDDLFYHYQAGFEKETFDIAIFFLHQATESYYAAIHLVFTDYKPKTHDLRDLNKVACHSNARFKTIFPDQTENEKRLFTILVKSHIDSRYKLNYSVNPKDLKWLEERVKIMRELTIQLCKQRISSLKNAR